MITAELVDEEVKKKLFEFHEMAQEFVEEVRKRFPDDEIKLTVRELSEDYWVNGNAYTICKSFYIPK